MVEVEGALYEKAELGGSWLVLHLQLNCLG